MWAKAKKPAKARSVGDLMLMMLAEQQKMRLAPRSDGRTTPHRTPPTRPAPQRHALR